MSTPSGQRSCSAMGNTPRVYPPDIDLVHASEAAIVRDSDADEWLKQTVIRRLEERHREQRAPNVRQLAALEARIRALAA